jgi:DNA-binding MarR family transcriptional regulator
MARLTAAGLTEAELSRLSSPIGLDLGARTPQETAISIAAEITAARWSGSGQRLTELRGRIHRDTDASLAPGDALADSTRTFLDVLGDDATGRDAVVFDLAGRLRQLGLALERRYAATEADRRLHRDDVDALVHLAGHDGLGPIPAQTLQHLLGISSGNASHRMAGLLERGWITMTRADHDRRVRLVRITAAGRTALAELLAARREVQEELLGHLDLGHVEALNRALRTLTARVEELDDGAP